MGRVLLIVTLHIEMVMKYCWFVHYVWLLRYALNVCDTFLLCGLSMEVWPGTQLSVCHVVWFLPNVLNEYYTFLTSINVYRLCALNVYNNRYLERTNLSSIPQVFCLYHLAV